MKFSNLFYIISTSLLVCSIAYADTCYDPNYDSYYNCQGDDYIAPVAAGLLFGAIISNNNGNNWHNNNSNNWNHNNNNNWHHNNGNQGGGNGGHGKHH
jgi:hypothetical protein